MFVQLIEGTTHEPEALRSQLERWERELRPQAVGFLGATAGVDPTGHVFDIARFESEEAARANSDRPQQGQWWAETERCLDPGTTFTESTDVELLMDGGSDEARFVQVMHSTGVDRDRMHELDAALEPYLAQRPEILGAIRIWTAPDACVEVVYFTDE